MSKLPEHFDEGLHLKSLSEWRALHTQNWPLDTYKVPAKRPAKRAPRR